MSTPQEQGQRFSLLYLQRESNLNDSRRFRVRLSRLYQTTFKDQRTYELGLFLEKEIGIEVLSYGFEGGYIDWDELKTWELRDVLCSITLVPRFYFGGDQRRTGLLSKEVQRILNEEQLGYWVDESCGVHPLVDPSYQAHRGSAIRGLDHAGYATAIGFINTADENLMPEGDPRKAIVAAFDATENVFKVIFVKAPALNKVNVQKYLVPYTQSISTDKSADAASAKMCAALVDWADACHNYRHAPGQPDAPKPTESLSTALVTQGFSFTRWLCDLKGA